MTGVRGHKGETKKPSERVDYYFSVTKGVYSGEKRGLKKTKKFSIFHTHSYKNVL